VTAGPKTLDPKARLHLASLPKTGSARVIAFIERYCRSPRASKGAKAGSPLKLRPWQREVVEGLYDPSPRPRQGLVSISRKNGKTLLAACLALYHLVGDGEASAEVLVVSSDERTAMVTFNLARRMVELEPRLAAVIEVHKSSLRHRPSDSVMEVLSGDATRAQGRGPSLAIVDECHVTSPDCWDALALGQATRIAPLILGISTECSPGDPDNLMARLVAHGRRQDDPAFFFREWTAKPGCDLHDEEQWAKANPMLGDTLDRDHLAALVKTTREAAFRRYHLNQRVAEAGAWMPPGVWEACALPGGIPDGADVVLALDGSFSQDATALVAATISTKPHLDKVALWEPPADDPEYRVPVAAVEKAIRDACRRWNVREVVADPFRWTRTLQALEAEGLPMVEMPQTAQRMAPATTGVYEAAINREMTHSGDADLARHVEAAHVRDDGRGVRLAKDKRESKRRIDLAVCAVMAHSRAQWHANKKPARRRVVAW
jgi:phage terminase large subunit-like protein